MYALYEPTKLIRTYKYATSKICGSFENTTIVKSLPNTLQEQQNPFLRLGLLREYCTKKLLDFGDWIGKRQEWSDDLTFSVHLEHDINMIHPR